MDAGIAPLLQSIGTALTPIATVTAAWLMTRRKSRRERKEAARGAAAQLITSDPAVAEAISEALARQQAQPDSPEEDTDGLAAPDSAAAGRRRGRRRRPGR